MKIRSIFVSILLPVFWAARSPPAVSAEFPETSTSPLQGILSTLRRGHPRLILTEDGLKQLRALISKDSGARKLRDSLRDSAERILREKTVEYKIVGPRLLTQSRRCLIRTYLLSLFYRLEGDKKFRHRAVKELEAAASFPDWNPSHFLDTAEMAHAFAIGYDWLFEWLDDSERAVIRDALIEKGLRPSLDFYRKGRWWVAARHNWNQVCNGGIAIGALAVAEEEPELAGYIVEQAIRSVRLPMGEYEPDGAWSEGPGYWHYATRYNVYLLAALESALGTDFDLSKMPGFSEAGMFRIHSTGPTELTFNFADAGARAGHASEMFWLSRRFNRPLYAWEERRQMGGGDAWDLLWYDPGGRGPAESGVPLSAHFRNVEVAFLRSAWEDRAALYVGFKGGDNRANHSHLDLGTFVFDALGVRWAHDLGRDDYNMPGYFGGKRWTYYRLKSEGHNIVTLKGENQNPQGRAPLIGFGGDPEFPFAIADLKAAYPGKLNSHQRGLALVEGRHLLVVDELELAEPSELHWTLQTAREIQIKGNRAEVLQRGRKLTARILSPEGAKFEVLPSSGPPPQAQSREIARLLFRVPAEANIPVRIAVLLTPHPADQPAPEFSPPPKPLKEWEKD